MGKEALVLILDGNDSMKRPCQQRNNHKNDNDNDTTTTTTTLSSLSRFDCAKQVAHDMISDLMIRSKTNEVVIILLKTAETSHHFAVKLENDDDDDDNDDSYKSDNDITTTNSTPFPNITELGGAGVGMGLCRPNPELLRKLHQLQPTEDSSDLRGDFCDGLIVGADALYRATSGKKYERRIVLITDAEHRIEVDQTQLLVVLDSLRAMECRLQVIGLDFEQEGDYAKAASAATAKSIKEEPMDDDDDDDNDYNDYNKKKNAKRSKTMNDNDDGSATDISEKGNDDDDDDSETDVSDNDDDDNDEDYQYLIKQQNEQLLLNLTEKTGGFVMSANELQPILQKVLGQRIPKSTRRKVIFQIAPGLSLDARFSYLLSKTSAPSLTKQVAMMEEQSQQQLLGSSSSGSNSQQPSQPQTLKNALGEEMTTGFQSIVSHWDPEKEEQEVTETARAYHYGSDLIPMGGLDISGLTNPSPVKITILGYMPESQVPRELRIGPPYALSGAESRRACAGISALARGLRKADNSVAIATMVKSKDADPVLVGLFPLEEGDDPIHLAVMQLPFGGDAKRIMLPPFDDDNTVTSSKQRAACDDLIDSLMLQHDGDGTALDYTKIPNPYVRSFHKTVVQRVLDPKCAVVSVRCTDDDDDGTTNDPMATPREILERSKPAMNGFRKAFPLEKTAAAAASTNKTKRRKGPASYRDFVVDENGDDDDE